MKNVSIARVTVTCLPGIAALVLASCCGTSSRPPLEETGGPVSPSCNAVDFLGNFYRSDDTFPSPEQTIPWDEVVDSRIDLAAILWDEYGDVDIVHLMHVSRLKQVLFSSLGNVSHEAFALFARNRSLSHLYFNHTPWLDAECINALQQSSVECIDLWHQHHLTMEDVALLKGSKKLRLLRLKDCPNVDPYTAQTMLGIEVVSSP